MKTISSWLVPLSLTLCAALVIGALAWITQATLATERERAGAEARADVQERTRLALWRMDSLGAALLLDESGYPEVESRLPVQLRFTLSSKGEIHAQTPDESPSSTIFHQTIGTGRQAIDRVSSITLTPVPETKELSRREATPEGHSAHGNRLDMQSQAAYNWSEQNVRSKAVQNTLEKANPNRLRGAPSPSASLIPPAADLFFKEESSPAPARDTGRKSAKQLPAAPSSMLADSAALEEALGPPNESHDDLASTPADETRLAEGLAGETSVDFSSEPVAGQPRVAWVDGLLVLARRINGMSSDSVFDGAWIDDDALAALLLEETGDLFTTASLAPAITPGTDGMVLASFPFRLEVPAPATIRVPLRQTTIISLAMSWAAALIALAATIWLIRGVMRLSERRASFVSAVTHELRTPLTTFRLYSDMLESGAVKEEKRGDYLRILSREADRLTHLVENVLAFSRIERGNARSHIRTIEAGELVESMRERLEARLESAGLHLALDVPHGLRVRADQAAVEHILFNLIDNAAKYAATSEPPVVTISATPAQGSVRLRIRDHGPGIPEAEIRRIFRPFHKSAHEAAETKPGVGLGLALSQRLAKEQGGELSCIHTSGGACFELRLPAAPAI